MVSVPVYFFLRKIYSSTYIYLSTHISQHLVYGSWPQWKHESLTLYAVSVTNCTDFTEHLSKHIKGLLANVLDSKASIFRSNLSLPRSSSVPSRFRAGHCAHTIHRILLHLSVATFRSSLTLGYVMWPRPRSVASIIHSNLSLPWPSSVPSCPRAGHCEHTIGPVLFSLLRCTTSWKHSVPLRRRVSAATLFIGLLL